MTDKAIYFGADMFGTCTMLFQFALFAIEAFGFALTLFLSAIESQLVVASFWILPPLVQPVRIWFPKRRRKPPDPTKLNKQSTIGTHPAHPIINWSLPSFHNNCKRGRLAAEAICGMDGACPDQQLPAKYTQGINTTHRKPK